MAGAVAEVFELGPHIRVALTNCTEIGVDRARSFGR